MDVLLVEDDVHTRGLFCRVLTTRGHDVQSFADAEAAWEACQRGLVPLMVVDWQLPGMNGLELCRMVRTLPGGDVPVILVATARDDPADLAKVLAAGANDYLAKPFGLSSLAVRLTVAEQNVAAAAARRRAEQLAREADRLQAVLLTTCTVEHHLGNQLALTMGYAELLLHDGRLPAELRPLAEEALDGVVQATATLEKLRSIKRLEEVDGGGPAFLDLDRSVQPA